MEHVTTVSNSNASCFRVVKLVHRFKSGTLVDVDDYEGVPGDLSSLGGVEAQGGHKDNSNLLPADSIIKEE